MSGDLIDTTEMYLKTVYELEEEGIPALRARIVERLGQSGPTVSETVARLERDGLLRIGAGRQIQFTDEGYKRAKAVMRRHRLAERLLLDVIGLDWADVHTEACRWEHVVSDKVATKIASLLNDPQADAFGNPIPDDTLPDQAGARGDHEHSVAGLHSLAEVAAAGPKCAPAADSRDSSGSQFGRVRGGQLSSGSTRSGSGSTRASSSDEIGSSSDEGAQAYQIVRFAERVQMNPEDLAAFAAAGMRPGVPVRVICARPDEVEIEVAGKSAVVPLYVAEGIYVH